jgi:hypothetical protein
MDPMSQEQFDRLVGDLRWRVGQVLGAISFEFPEGYIYDPEAHLLDVDVPCITGLSVEYPMKTIAGAIDGVLHTFDLLQEGLGLPKGEEPRFRRLVRGGADGPPSACGWMTSCSAASRRRRTRRGTRSPRPSARRW